MTVDWYMNEAGLSDLRGAPPPSDMELYLTNNYNNNYSSVPDPMFPGPPDGKSRKQQLVLYHLRLFS